MLTFPKSVTVGMEKVDVPIRIPIVFTWAYLHQIGRLRWDHCAHPTDTQKAFRSQVGSIEVTIPDEDLASFHA